MRHYYVCTCETKKYKQVEVDKEEACIHCGFYAIMIPTKVRLEDVSIFLNGNPEDSSGHNYLKIHDQFKRPRWVYGWN
jgi:adenine-specific DNA methylase